MKRKLIAIILCVAMLIPCTMTNVFADGDTGSVYNSGKVLYNQEFGESFIGKTLADAGLTEYTEVAPNANGNRHFVEVTSAGILQVRTTDNRYFLCLSLPENIAPDHGTYTVEMKFSFRPNASNRAKANGRFGFAWGEISDFYAQSNYSQVTVNYLSTGNTAKLNFDTDENFEKVRNAWAYTGTDYSTVCGSEVTMKVSLDGGYLDGVYFECNGNEWYSATPQAELELAGDIGIYIGDCCTDISYIRVVEGTTASIDAVNGYTESDLDGTLATKSYSEIPLVNTYGVQKSKTENNTVRFVAEIKGINFDEAGFDLAITYTPDGAAEETTKTVKKSVKYAYTSVLGDGEEYKPTCAVYYIIVLEVTDIPNGATIEATPYVLSGETKTPCATSISYTQQ